MLDRILINLGMLIAGIALLYKCSDVAVESAAQTARRLGVSQLMIGLTVIAIGTSLPEFAVSVLASIAGQGDIAVANIAGSNIYNLGFILGACALIRPILISRDLVYRDCAIMLGGSVMLGAFMWNLEINRLEGAVFLGCLVAWLYALAKLGKLPEAESERGKELGVKRSILMLGLGLAGVIAGAQLLLKSAVDIAELAGWSRWLIGVTIVAIGTSLPETAVSIAAAIKKYYEISVGNLVGSNIFNIFGVVGAAGAISAMYFAEASRISVILLLGLMVFVTGLMRTGWRVSRAEGIALLAVMGLGYYWIGIHG